MPYLVVNENTWCDNGEVVNEGLKTAAHNIWTRNLIGGGHVLNTKHKFGDIARKLSGLSGIIDLGTALATGSGIASIASPLVAIGLAIAGNISSHKFGGVDKLDQKYFNSMFAINQSMVKKLSNLCAKHKATAFTEDEIYLKIPGTTFNKSQNVSVASRMTRKATRGFGNGMFSTATCYKFIPFKNNRKFIVYLTFNEDEILDCKALVYKYNPEDITHRHAQKDFTVVDIPEIKQISPELYKK